MLLRLVRLELTKLLPWIYVLASIDVLSSLYTFFGSTPNQYNWAASLPLLQAPESAGLWTSLLALLLSYAGFARDSEDGTLAFVFSLPVPRSQIFLAKLIAPGLVLSGEVLLSELLRWLQQLNNPTSFGGHTFRADWQGWALVLSLLVVWIALGYGQLLTAFRRFGVLIVIALYFAVRGLAMDHPWLRHLAPGSILHAEFAGQRALIQWRSVGAHVFGALLAGSLAAYIWVGPTERFTSVLQRWARRPLLAWAAGLVSAGLAIAAIAHKDQSVSAASPAAPSSYGSDDSTAFDSPPAVRWTRRYELRYPENLAARIEPLAAAADDIYERLAERLGLGPREQPVFVDLTRRSAEDAGSATLNTIRMDPMARPGAEELERTFAHETTHVISFLASDRRMTSKIEAVGFFGEGLAVEMSLELRPSAENVRALELEAVLARQRLQPTFADMIRYEAFTLRQGPLLVYPLGFTWTRALIESCGVDAPARVLKALGSPDAPLTLAPEALWQHLLQRAECDIVRVNAAWENQLSALAAQLKPEVDRVPTLLAGTPHWAGDEVRVLARLDGAALDGTELALLVRIQTTGPESHGIAFPAKPGPNGEIEFHIPSKFVQDGALQFQLAQRFDRQGFPVHDAYAWNKSLVTREPSAAGVGSDSGPKATMGH